jgi:2-oxoglutarate dehydrogenase E2 component (dihydrolipoamide succinyltransferase)
MGESIAEGTLSKWLKKVGDVIKRDEPIFEISTDKVDAEIPAPSSGVLAEILVTEGQTVPVQAIVARMETDVNAAVQSAAPQPVAAPPAVSAGPASRGSGAAPPPATTRTPAAAGASPQSDAVRAGPIQSNGGNSLEDRLRTKSSPLVRRMAAEHGVEIGGLKGSGIAGRVTKRDLMDFLDSGGGAPHAGAAAGAGRPPVHGPLPEAWPGDVV